MIELIDCMPVTSQGLGSGRVVRVVRCREGYCDVELALAPRFDFGLTVPRVDLISPHRGVVFGGADGLLVESDFSMTRQNASAVATIRLNAGDEARTVLTYLPDQRRDISVTIAEVAPAASMIAPIALTRRPFAERGAIVSVPGRRGL